MPRRRLRSFPLAVRIGVGAAALVVVAFAVNWIYQAARKPAELFFPVSGVLVKTPAETWRHYEPIFRQHSTTVITPDFLAALAQVEGTGNPVARTYWRWRLTSAPFEIYRPASSAVGMYQITDATFSDARRYCIRDHAVLMDGAWHEWRSCWFNSFYMRVVPSHAAEMTSAFLDRSVAAALGRSGTASATLQQKQDLAAVIHLCGNATGDAYARRGFRLTERQRCGDHEVRAYLVRVNAMKRLFRGLSSARRVDSF